MVKNIISAFTAICFVLTGVMGCGPVYAKQDLFLPAPGTMVNLSPAYEPVIIKGLTVHKDRPFLFDFIVDAGQDNMSGEPLKNEGEKLIKYFLAGLAIPDKDVWVNLSPYEKNKIVPEALGQTDMGRDLLEQDYILKQVTASLIYPEKQLGRIFWDKVYLKARQMYGTTQVPVNTFNKVWIMADRAEVFEHNQTAFVVDSHLKVMLEEDYLALQKHRTGPIGTRSIGANMVKDIVLPQLEKEVNTGKNFANLRQIFNSIILASWYKRNLKQALLNQVYANKAKVKGIERLSSTVIPEGIQNQDLSPQQIYEQYLKAYKKGVFNYIKEDVDASGTMLPRKYFSGGIDEAMAAHPAITTNETALKNALPNRAMISFQTLLRIGQPEHEDLRDIFGPSKNSPAGKDQAMTAPMDIDENSTVSVTRKGENITAEFVWEKQEKVIRKGKNWSLQKDTASIENELADRVRFATYLLRKDEDMTFDEFKDLINNRISVDAAMGGRSILGARQTQVAPGGIDLNTASGMQWRISKDGNGVETNVDPAMIQRIRQEGIDSLSPVIVRITPVTSVWSLAGLQLPKNS